VGSLRVNGDGTADWCGLTAEDLAAVVHACACARFILRRGRFIADVEAVAYEALGGCMAVWEYREEAERVGRPS